jgi:hypothetical protein
MLDYCWISWEKRGGRVRNIPPPPPATYTIAFKFRETRDGWSLTPCYRYLYVKTETNRRLTGYI